MTEIQRNPSKEVAREESTRPGRSFVPSVDICETPAALLLWADLPGVDDKSVEVHLADGVLSIEGRVSPVEYEDLTPAYTEYNVGNFVRRFTLSRDIDSERIRARMLNGVLELDLPKASHTLPRRIEIRS